jgi:ABC-type phosphate transport system substrate-binding protein
MKIKQVAMAALGIGMISAVVVSGVAQADPQGAPAQRILSAEGSDTTEGVMNAIANSVTSDGSSYVDPQTNAAVAAGTKVIASYNAVGAGGFTSKTGTNPFTGTPYTCVYTGNPTPNSNYLDGARANGSGNGFKALQSALVAGDPTANCLDFSRASSLRSGGVVNVTNIPFAVDALTFAVTNSSALPRQLTLADLLTVYNCTFGLTPAQVTAGNKETAITALVPQAGSGTTSFWEGVLGLVPANVGSTAFPCLTDSKNYSSVAYNTTPDAQGLPIGYGDVHLLANINPAEEHDGRVLSDHSVIGLSIPQYIAQMSGTLADIRGREVLGSLDGSAPVLLNSTFGVVGALNDHVVREVYNVVPTPVLTGTPAAGTPAAAEKGNITKAFVGSTSDVCKQTTIIQQYGYQLAPDCGDTTHTG